MTRLRSVFPYPRVAWLAAGLLLLSAGSNTTRGQLPPDRRTMAAELLNRGSRISTYRSFVDLGRFYLKNGSLSRARQILLYGLLHEPSNPRLLTEAARAELALSHPREALTYAAAAHRIEATSDRARLLAEARAAVQSLPAEEEDPSPAEEEEEETEEGSEVEEGKEEDGQEEEGESIEGELEDRRKALNVGRAIEAAVRAYNIDKGEKDRMVELDTELLVAAELLPPGMDLSIYPVSKLGEDGSVTFEEYGTTAELREATGEYEQLLAAASGHLRAGELSEAAFRLRDLRKKFPEEPEIGRRLMDVYRRQGRVDDSIALVEEELEIWPGSTTLRHERFLLLLQAGRTEQALEAGADLAESGTGVHAVLARQAVDLLKNGPDRELLEDLEKLTAGEPAAASPTTTSGESE